MALAVLITGGNIGQVRQNMARAVELIGCSVGYIVAQSSLQSSKAWGFKAVEPFSNQVLVVETELLPEELLDATQKIERSLGRCKVEAEYDKSGQRVYHSRTMDIDILYYDDIEISTPQLTIPHPEIAKREFVIRLLEEIKESFGEKNYIAYKKSLSLFQL